MGPVKKKYTRVSHSSSFVDRTRCPYCKTGPVDVSTMKVKFSQKDPKPLHLRRIMCLTSIFWCEDFRNWNKYFYNSYNPEGSTSVSHHSSYKADNLSFVFYCKCGQSIWMTGSQSRKHVSNRLAKIRKPVQRL